jgi:glycine/D-amino acid oxidase-like deaminating enzyme
MGSPVSPDYDLVVVGCGLAGSATAWAAARRGASVLVLEQFAAGHRRGSSHGSSRIVRRAYRDVLYTRLSGEAFELWREVEQQSGTTLLRMLGALDFGPGRDAELISAHLTACSVAHEVLAAVEAERRWPGMRFEGEVVHHFQAATMDSQAAVDAMTALAGRNGAEVTFGRQVVALRIEHDMARVELRDGDAVTARRAVVAAGAWVQPLTGTLLPLPAITVTQQQVFHFARLDVDAPPWPSVIHVPHDGGEFYHLAGGRDGGPGDDRKVGEHGNGTETTAETRDAVIDPSSRQRVVDYVQRWLPGLDPSPRAEASCLYTHTPSGDFLIERAGPLVVCSPCSGHGAKFAPLIGELNVRLAFGEGDVPDRFRSASHAATRDATAGL